MTNEEREKRLTEAADAYYNGNPTMSDADFDFHRTIHDARRDQTPDDPIWKDTILDKVGARPTAGTKVKHRSQMLSLDNAFVADDGGIDEVFAWLKRVSQSIPSISRIIAEPKIDGLSVRLSYFDGHLTGAVTRGDGSEGEDVTANVKEAKLVPERLTETVHGLTEVNGEVFMSFAAFEKLNEHQAELGEDLYANPRNAAAGILRRKDPTTVKGLSFLAHGVAAGGTEDGYDRETSRMVILGIPFPHQRPLLANGNTKTGSDPVTLEWLREIVDECDYPVDGVVLKVCGFNYQDQLGCTSRAPRWAVAVKFQQEEVETTLTGITVQVGRSGVLTPVAELEPVEVDGSVVSRASLHNEDQINRLHLQVGDRVFIRKAGAIIPEVVRSITAAERTVTTGFNMQQHLNHKCPSCGQQSLEMRQTTSGGDGKITATATMYTCSNTAACPSQMAGRIEYMANRNNLDIDQMGGEVCDAIAASRRELEAFRHPFDLLSVPTSWFAKLSWTTDSGSKMTFGKSRAEKVSLAMEHTQRLPLNRWISSLGISSVGKNTSKEITRLIQSRDSLIVSCTHPQGIFREMVASLDEDPKKQKYEEHKARFGISHHLGPVSLQKLLAFVLSSAGQYALSRIPTGIRSDNYNPDPPKAAEGPLAGKAFVITGTLSLPRDHFKKVIEDSGGKVSSGVSKKTDYLLAGEKAGSKLKKAEDLGVVVLNEEAFGEMLA